MHVLKFTQETGEPSGIFLDETIGFGDSVTNFEFSITYYESIGFNDIVPQGISEILYETIGFNESQPVFTSYIACEETIGFDDSSDETLKVHCEETIGFDDDAIQDLALDILCNETIGFDESGYGLLINAEHDITISWRTRTNADATYGYGGAEYGSIVSYGDGDADNLASFEVHIWQVGGPDSNRYLNSNPAGEFDERLTVQTITINDTGDPDADASYTLTIANNKSWNGGTFLSEMEVEVFVKDSDDIYSWPKIIVVEDDRNYFE